jgi:hypothetical protein
MTATSDLNGSLVAENERLNNRVTELVTENAFWVRLIDAFRIQVRDVAIDVASEQGWCESGLNRRLEELGLDPVLGTAEWTIEVNGTVTVTFHGERPDPDDAREWLAANGLGVLWNGEPYEDVEIDSVAVHQA